MFALRAATCFVHKKRESMAATTMAGKKVRNFSKRGDAIAVPDLTQVQRDGYERFLQNGKGPDERDIQIGLEALLREVFPIESYDGTMRLEYTRYVLEEPRYTPDECRELRLTYGRPFRIGVLLKREGRPDMPEEDIYLGEFPIMMGGGEFIVNGAERVIVSQLHRSPGVDFSIISSEGDRPLHSTRVIPERGSWIELEVTKKDVLAMRIDQSTKMAATTFLRCLDESISNTDQLLGLFYEISEINAEKVKPEHWAAASIIDTETGEELVHVGRQIGEENAAKIAASSLKKVRVIENPSDVLILNTVAEEKLERSRPRPSTSVRSSRCTASCVLAIRPRWKRPSNSSPRSSLTRTATASGASAGSASTASSISTFPRT
jgi:DNA-directed RNA polymerase subunit beta